MSDLQPLVSNPCIRLQTCSIKGTKGDQREQMRIDQSGELISPPIFFVFFFVFNLAIWHAERVSCEGKWSPFLSERESLQTQQTVTGLCYLQCLESCFACERKPGWKTVRGGPWSRVSLRPSKDKWMSLPSLYNISGVMKRALPHKGWERPSETTSNSSVRESSNEDLRRRVNLELQVQEAVGRA